MKKVILLTLCFLLLFSSFLLADELVLENFEDGNCNDAPTWWTFDAVQLTAVPNSKDGLTSLGKYWLKIAGTAENWYVGGLGATFKAEAFKYDALQVDVYGTGSRSGRLKIELYDDDNDNQEIEQDEAKNYAPIFDDRWVYEVKVDWTGWKTVTILLSQFKDDNPGVGNDKFDPAPTNGSGGLVNLQLILIATSKTGSVDLGLDNIKLIQLPKAGK